MFGLDKAALRIVAIFALVIILCLLGFGLSYCSKRGDDAKGAAQTSNATGKALDKVAEQTPAIRQEQQEKQDEVDTIKGADARLPDGFGADLERVRHGKRQHP